MTGDMWNSIYVHKEEAGEINSYPVTVILSLKACFSLYVVTRLQSSL